MLSFLARKISHAILILLGVATVTFVITNILPGDPTDIMLGQHATEASREALREQMGLNRPLFERYISSLSGLFTLDFGRSYTMNQDVFDSIVSRVPATALLAGVSMSFATILGVLLGVLAARKPFGLVDRVLMSSALAGISVPSFVSGSVLQLVFGSMLFVLPVSGYVDKGFSYLVLPALTLGIRPLSIISRVTRSGLLDVLKQDFIRTARSKGLSSRQILLKHALPNVWGPVITTVSSWFAAVLSGTFFIEYIFNWPGIGLLTINAIQQLDFPMIQGTVLFTASVFVVVNLLVDIAYSIADPRVELA